jgi:malate synthase
MTIEIASASDVAGGDEILTDDALAFVEELHHRFDRAVASCSPRGARARPDRRGGAPRLPPGDPRRARGRLAGAAAAAALTDRRVEITGRRRRRRWRSTR